MKHSKYWMFGLIRLKFLYQFQKGISLVVVSDSLDILYLSKLFKLAFIGLSTGFIFSPSVANAEVLPISVFARKFLILPWLENVRI